MAGHFVVWIYSRSLCNEEVVISHAAGVAIITFLTAAMKLLSDVIAYLTYID